MKIFPLTLILLVTLTFVLLAQVQEEQGLVVTDLGQVGKVTPLTSEDFESMEKDNKEFYQKTIEPIKEKMKRGLEEIISARRYQFEELMSSDNFSFHTSLPRHYGKPASIIKHIESQSHLPLGSKILFFSWEDTIRPQNLQNIFAAYCLSYRNLGDITKWKEKHKVNFFVQPLTDDEVCYLLGVESYPAIVTIKGGEEIEVYSFPSY